MIVMPANNSNAHKLEAEYPGRAGLLIGPTGWRAPRGLPYALDNGRFVCWSKGKPWDEAAFLRLCESAMDNETLPSWIVVPDSVGDATETFVEWDRWEPCLRKTGVPLALAVQDGMTPASVHRHANPDVIFVGGTTEWKRRTIWQWCQGFPRVHVGRVNTEKWLWNADRCGAESVDGTGFFRGCKRQLAGLHRYLRLSSLGLNLRQKEIAYADGFRR
jgi:hypothetical protein